MKARITHSAILLYWQREGVAPPQLDAVCRAVPCILRTASRRDAGKTVGALCGAPGSKKNSADLPENLPEGPVLVMYNFSDVQLDTLLAALKQNDLQIPLKAVLTPSNRDWPLFELAAELGREHEQLNGGR